MRKEEYVKKEEFVINKIIRQIRNGMLLHKPVVYLQTSELEIVRRVINSDEVVVRMAKCSADTIMPFAKLSDYEENAYHNALNNDRVINMHNCSLKDLRTKAEVCKEWENYGRFTFNQKARYPLPSLLAVHVRKNAEPYPDFSAFDGLFPFIDRYGQETDDSCAIRSSLVLLYGEETELPAWLMTYCYIVQEPYPDREEIAEVIRKKVSQSEEIFLKEDVIESYVSGFLGNTLIQVENTVDYLLNLPDDMLTGRPTIENKGEVQRVLATLKEQNVKRVGLLELQKADKEENLGGMAAFHRWMEKNKKSILQSDDIFRKTGAVGHKGILMCGIPGCGKSAAVNLLAKELELPVLKMDIGRLMGGIVGESEHNMHLALRLAEAMAPCILYIDEIEKGFSGSDGKGEDTSGVTKRMFGILLSWMQDCTKPVYMFATANSLAGIPKEFFRSGRFDSHFALYMPTREECIDIFKKRMEKAEKTVRTYDRNSQLFMKLCYDDEKLGLVTDYLLYEENGQKKGRFLTGADITKLVNMALRQFAERKGAISHTEWIQALKKAADGTAVYGDGEENMDSIAVCYLRMMRLGFKATSDHCLFEPKDYSVTYEEGKLLPSVSKKEAAKTEYDQVLYDTIRNKMLFLAKELEEHAMTELTR